jgi:hypothetical protein
MPKQWNLRLRYCIFKYSTEVLFFERLHHGCWIEYRDLWHAGNFVACKCSFLEVIYCGIILFIFRIKYVCSSKEIGTVQYSSVLMLMSYALL